jgi:hypothetical protein
VTPKRVYSFMIDPELDAALKEIKERDGISEGEQIRRALKAWFAERGVHVEKKTERKRPVNRKRS